MLLMLWLGLLAGVQGKGSGASTGPSCGPSGDECNEPCNEDDGDICFEGDLAFLQWLLPVLSVMALFLCCFLYQRKGRVRCGIASCGCDFYCPITGGSGGQSRDEGPSRLPASQRPPGDTSESHGTYDDETCACTNFKCFGQQCGGDNKGLRHPPASSELPTQGGVPSHVPQVGRVARDDPPGPGLAMGIVV